MHQLENWDEAYRIAGIKPNYGRQLKKRGQPFPIGVLFGLPVAGSIPFDLDAAFIRATLDLGSGLEQAVKGRLERGLTVAARLTYLHCHELLTGLGRADAERRVPVFLVAMEDVKGGYRMAQGVLTDIAKWRTEDIATIRKMTFINVTDLLDRLRKNARKFGLDLSDPLFPPPGDALYEQALAQGEKEREEVKAKVRAWLEARQ